MATKTKKSNSIIELEDQDVIPNSQEYITFKASHFYSVLVVLAFAVGILVGYVAWGRNASIAAVPAAAAPAAQQAQPPGQVAAAPTAQPQYVRYDIPTDGFPSLGPADAKITIVEFSDFQCPFCRQFQQNTYQPLLDAYPNEIRFVYRNLPLTSIHPNAMGAAIAAQCANDQNAFWPFHDKLFSSESLGDDVYKQYATDLSLDMDKFNACLTSGDHDAAIKADMDYSLSIGVQSTPTFFVNGLAIVGAQPLSNFQQLIDKELAGEIPTN